MKMCSICIAGHGFGGHYPSNGAADERVRLAECECRCNIYHAPIRKVEDK